MTDRALPPGQHVSRGWPVLHYGPVPKLRSDTWDLRVFGATLSGADQRWDNTGFEQLPRAVVDADFHCVTRFTVPRVHWMGVPAAAVLDAVPPADDATHVMVWAEYGYSANLRMADFADVWQGQRYSYQEAPGEGPPFAERSSNFG